LPKLLKVDLTSWSGLICIDNKLGSKRTGGGRRRIRQATTNNDGRVERKEMWLTVVADAVVESNSMTD
jgi:hypothetical protein